ncbi:hypothetical protein MNB_SUP05-SYMBIONT-5-922 [hydrothermal vent metagenome]|uniref:Mobile element protein n=1 Tax=hydrothermal vent metagenome TaxID=652676 RepID=A0A1W1E2T2_9ZZZZ
MPKIENTSILTHRDLCINMNNHQKSIFHQLGNSPARTGFKKITNLAKTEFC